MSNPNEIIAPVTIDAGLCDWQILQQDANGVTRVTVSGRWWTVMKRRQPEVHVRIVREGTYTAISRRHDWMLAETVAVEDDGKRGTWSLMIDAIPRGGPYRVETMIGSAEDAVEWRRTGDTIHFLGVGDVWLIAGQSNAAGTTQSPIDDPAEIGVQQFDSGTGWQLAAHGSRHHPWLAFAKTLKKELGYPIGLIPTAVGGTPVSRWDPGQNGDLYIDMVRQIKESGGRIKGCLWYQGESDTGAVDHPQYKTRFARLLTGLREVTGQPQLPVITVQLNRLLTCENGPGWEAIREAQRQLSHDLEQVYLISVFESVLSDLIHNSSLGNLLIAQRAADTALGGIYGKDIAFRHPECSRALKLADTTVELHFDNIVTRLDFIGVGCPFAVRDDQGEVPVTGWQLPGKATFWIELARPLAGRVTVTGAPGSCPPHVVPRDIHGYRGMLAFTRTVE